MSGDPNSITPVGVVTGGLAVVVVGSAVGAVTDMSRRLRQEIVTRKQMQNELLAAQRRHLEASMEAQFLRASRMASLGTLAAGVAHEINNPLAYLTSNLRSVRAALSGPQPPPPQELKDAHDALNESIEGAQRIETIVKAIRVFSPRPSDDFEELVDVRSVAATALEAVRGLLRTRAAVSSHFEGEPTIRGNTGRLGQVFIHLLVNAAEAIPEGRPDQHRVTLAGRAERDRVVLEVSDTGRGIPPDVLPKIFEPFFTTKPAHSGTGLGLFVSKGIVTSMGGTLTARSEPGRGSTFTIDLPSASR
jgi:signal transduction histidine kinase